MTEHFFVPSVKEEFADKSQVLLRGTGLRNDGMENFLRTRVREWRAGKSEGLQVVEASGERGTPPLLNQC